MLEQIALSYINQSVDILRLTSYGFCVIGAIIAGVFYKSSSELKRAPYFAYSGLFFFIAAASQIVWLSSIPALTGGFVWIFMLVDIFAALGIGFAIGIIAMARSRDAYGHARMAALAFIPIANFWLLLTPSRKELSANRVPTIPLLTGIFGVLTGFVLLIAGVVLSAFIQIEANRIVAEAENDPALQRSEMDMMLRGQGLEETLRQMAAEVPPQRVDETTTLLRIVSDGPILRYVYEVSTNLDVIPASMRTSVVQHNCTYAALRPVIEAGATIEHVYQQVNGREIGSIIVSRDNCEF